MPEPLETRNALSILAALAVLALAVFTGPAQAQAQPDPSWSAVDAYVEQVPSAGGGSAPGTRGETESSLPPAARTALQKSRAATAAALEKVSSSSIYGAPASETQQPATSGKTTSVSVGDSLRGSADAIGTASDTRLLALLIVVLVTTVGALTLAARRARKPSSGSSES